MKSTVLFIFIMCLYGCFGKAPSITTGHEGKLMPAMRLLLTDSITLLNLKTISTGKPSILFFFRPHCPYCRALTKDICDNIHSLAGIRIYMISDAKMIDLHQYIKDNKLNMYSNIIVGQDYDIYFNNYFKAPGVPCIAIYDKENKLKQVLMGEVRTNLLLDIATE